MTVEQVRQKLRNAAISFATQGSECFAKEDVFQNFIHSGVHIQSGSFDGQFLRTSIDPTPESAFCKPTSQEIEAIVATICTNRVNSDQDCTREDVLGSFPVTYKNQIISSTSSNGAFVKSIVVNLPEALFLRVQQEPIVNITTEQPTITFTPNGPIIITNSSTQAQYITPPLQNDKTTSTEQSAPSDQPSPTTSEPPATKPKDEQEASPSQHADEPQERGDKPESNEPSIPFSTESEKDTIAPTEEKKTALPTESPTPNQDYDGVVNGKDKELVIHIQDNRAHSIVPYLIIGGVALTVALVGLCVFSPFKFKKWYCGLSKCKRDTSVTYNNIQSMSIYNSSPESPTGITVEPIVTPHTKSLESSVISEFDVLPPRTPPLATTPINHAVGNVEAPRSPLQVISSRTPPPLDTTTIDDSIRKTLLIEQPSHLTEDSQILAGDLQSN